MNSVYLALGSNMGDREQHLRAGLDGLSTRGIHIVRRASLYSTEPREILDQPWFLNTVVEVNTDLGPEELLQTCLEVERENHRVRGTPKGPRTLDIDIVLFGQEVIHNSELTIPHPNFAVRRFVLVPLAEIAPDVVDPRSGKTIRRLLEICNDDGEVQFRGRLE